MNITKNKIQLNEKVTESITFQLEELERPTTIIKEHSLNEVLAKYSDTIEAHSALDSSLVSNGFHSFLYGMYQAYSEHRPFTLSPDMIWLLVCQGFARHVNFSNKSGQHLFPHLSKKQTIVIENNDLLLGNSSSPWSEVPQQFTQKLSEFFDDDLINSLSADFSTTGSIERTACAVTIMDAMKPYFEYIVNVCICGIPEITLEGKTEDWKKILNKLSKLKTYQLDWWINKLEDILVEFVNASQGEVNRVFWMNMFKVHTDDDYGRPEHIDGWITHFYPYDRDGNIINFKEKRMLSVEEICDELPKELVCVDFIYRVLDDTGEQIEETPMEFWAGFIGLTQDKVNYSLRPTIGWFVAHKTLDIPNESKHKYTSDSRVYYNLTSFPKELFKNRNWGYLVLNFKGEIDLPLKIFALSISSLVINGDVSNKLKLKLKLFRRKFKIKLNGVEL